MKIAIFGKSPISENKWILKITMFILNTRITRKALISGYDSFFTFTNLYGKYLHIFRPHYCPRVHSTSNKLVPGIELTALSTSRADCLEIWESQLPGTLRAYTGIALPLNIYTCLNVSSRRTMRE
jgi:hypothetical protein